MTQMTTNVYTHYVVTYSRVNYPITQQQFEVILAMDLDGEMELDGNIIKRKNISDILTAEKFREAFPDKEKKNYNPISRPLQSFEDIVDEFKWASFGDMLGLIIKTHRAMRKWTGDFKSFCLKHRAILPNGSVATMRVTLKSGRVDHIPFAYPFFAAVAKLIEQRNEQKAPDLEPGQSWDEIMNMAPNI